MLGAAKEQTVKRTHTQNQGRFNVHGSPECYQKIIASGLLLVTLTGCATASLQERRAQWSKPDDAPVSDIAFEADDSTCQNVADDKSRGLASPVSDRQLPVSSSAPRRREHPARDFIGCGQEQREEGVHGRAWIFAGGGLAQRRRGEDGDQSSG